MKFICLLVLAMFGAEAKVTSPATAAVNVPVLIDAADSVGTLEWETNDPDLVIFPAIRGGRQAYIQRLSPGVGRFTITAKDKAGTAVCREVIVFEGKGPAPSPAPTPGPDVNLPDGRFKVAAEARRRAGDVKVSRAEQRRQEALQIAGVLEGVRDKIKSGQIDTGNPMALMQAIRSGTQALPADVQSRWGSWGGWWTGVLKALYLASKLTSPTDWIDLLTETISGLKAVK